MSNLHHPNPLSLAPEESAVEPANELRLDPLSGRWVAISGLRAKRPISFDATPSLPVETAAKVCPFCPGNEEPVDPFVTREDDKGNWKIRIVPNLYPAFNGNGPLEVEHLGPVHTQALATGTHEVWIFDTNHNHSWADLDDAQIDLALDALSERLGQHAASGWLRYSQAIINVGRDAGASIAHPHGQIISVPFIPSEIANEQAGFERFRGHCLMCTTLEAERAAGIRVVLSTEDTVVISPFWAGHPYELLILPTKHQPFFHDADPQTRLGVGRAVRDTLLRLKETIGEFPYNVVLHSSPFRVVRDFHWHVHLVPKLTTRAGFEMGTGIMINVIPPELAAEKLRSARHGA